MPQFPLRPPWRSNTTGQPSSTLSSSSSRMCIMRPTISFITTSSSNRRNQCQISSSSNSSSNNNNHNHNHNHSSRLKRNHSPRHISSNRSRTCININRRHHRLRGPGPPCLSIRTNCAGGASAPCLAKLGIYRMTGLPCQQAEAYARQRSPPCSFASKSTAKHDRQASHR
mmetsp:Transcript_5059/g.14413  ORF Transcript_5059/g.14413 Transcript_5059/m.14413 type:complete len:170 (-) Transcript_5059:122-631(-)